MAILDHCAPHVRPDIILWHSLPGDYSLAANAGCGRLFLLFEILDTPGQQAGGV
jgi:hypothetical protein